MLDPPSLSVQIRYDRNYTECIKTTTLTFIPIPLLADKKRLGLSNDCLTSTGSHMCRELNMATSISGGADAVIAIKGTFVNARKPPSVEKDFRNSLPLSEINQE